MSRYIIEVLKGKTKWYWRLKFNNGHVLAHSEVYSTRAKARKTAYHLATKLGCVYKEQQR